MCTGARVLPESTTSVSTLGVEARASVVADAPLDPRSTSAPRRPQPKPCQGGPQSKARAEPGASCPVSDTCAERGVASETEPPLYSPFACGIVGQLSLARPWAVDGCGERRTHGFRSWRDRGEGQEGSFLPVAPSVHNPCRLTHRSAAKVRL